MKNVMDELQNKKVMIFNETHPRVNYSFFRRMRMAQKQSNEQKLQQMPGISVKILK